MIAKPNRNRASLLWIVCLGLLLPTGLLHAAITWTITISPSDSGSVVWQTSSPAASGTLIKSGKITFNTGALVDLTFQPKAGGSIAAVYKNLDNVTGWLDGSKHYQFGPVSNPHTITALFNPPPDPTGNYSLTFPTNDPALTTIIDASGNYSGTARFSIPRTYDVDVAVDESGKATYMGTVQGFTPTGGGALSGVGAIRTVNGEPRAEAKGSFAGTRDGLATSGTGSATGLAQIQDIGSGTNGVEATVGYQARVGGIPATAKATPAVLPLTPASVASVKKDWNLQLNIASKVDANGRTYAAASAILLLPNGDSISFPEQRAKYSERGYWFTFTNGTNITMNPNTVDRKTWVSIKHMLLTKQGAVYQPTSGTISYQFLGQKGSGDLLSFMNR